ncbi:MAG TPA: hypothetical protein VLC98_07930 [Phnomibacter sp.]|nr:hypothetical protein [Phnomibacter sp.]
MKYLVLLLLLFPGFSVDAAVMSQPIDSLPTWEVFKKMSTAELKEMAKEDPEALKIIEGEKKPGYVFGAVGLGVLAVLAGIGANHFGTLDNSFLSTLMAIVLGVAAIMSVIIATLLVIRTFSPSRKKQYKQLKELLAKRESKG